MNLKVCKLQGFMLIFIWPIFYRGKILTSKDCLDGGDPLTAEEQEEKEQLLEEVCKQFV